MILSAHFVNKHLESVNWVHCVHSDLVLNIFVCWSSEWCTTSPTSIKEQHTNIDVLNLVSEFSLVVLNLEEIIEIEYNAPCLDSWEFFFNLSEFCIYLGLIPADYANVEALSSELMANLKTDTVGSTRHYSIWIFSTIFSKKILGTSEPIPLNSRHNVHGFPKDFISANCSTDTQCSSLIRVPHHIF